VEVTGEFDEQNRRGLTTAAPRRGVRASSRRIRRTTACRNVYGPRWAPCRQARRHVRGRLQRSPSRIVSPPHHTDTHRHESSHRPTTPTPTVTNRLTDPPHRHPPSRLVSPTHHTPTPTVATRLSVRPCCVEWLRDESLRPPRKVGRVARRFVIVSERCVPASNAVTWIGDERPARSKPTVGHRCHTRRVPFESWFRGVHGAAHGRTTPGGSWRSGGARSVVGRLTATPARAARGCTARTLVASAPIASAVTITSIISPRRRHYNGRQAESAPTPCANPMLSSADDTTPQDARSRCAAHSPDRRARDHTVTSDSLRMFPGHVARARDSVA
jgi:hypothetical protein